MTEKQEAFCREYLIDYNATQAAIRAGYSEKTAKVTGYKMLQRDAIKAYITTLKDEKEQEYGERLAGAMEIKAFLAAAMRGEINEEVVITIATGGGRSKTENIRKQLAAKDRIRAAETLARIELLFLERLKVESPIPIVITGEDAL